MQSKWGRTVLAFRRVKRDSPIVIELLCIVIIIAIFLGIDIGYMSQTHKKEMVGMEALHQKQIDALEKRYKDQFAELDAKQSNHKDDFLKHHQSHTNVMREKQRETLESMVTNLNTKLKDLVNAADLHWDDHDKFHEDGEPLDKQDSPKVEHKQAGGRAVVGGGFVNFEQERPPRPTSAEISSKSQLEQLTQQDSKLSLDQASDLLKVLQKAREVEHKS